MAIFAVDSKRPILITGSSGQVGRALLQHFRYHFPKVSVLALSRGEADLSNLKSLPEIIKKFEPSVVFNAAAYTKVDLAEKEEALANIVNGEAVGVLAQECVRANIPFVHFSTDYVFSDALNENSDFRIEAAQTHPINAYGRSKLLGEKLVSAAGGRYLIFRTSWVYDCSGSNFFNTMLRLGSEREKISVVKDQIGAPTYGPHLAAAAIDALCAALRIEAQGSPFPSGIYHVTNSGTASWYEFASQIFQVAKERGVVLRLKELNAVSSEDYVTAAARPKNSRLDGGKLEKIFGLRLPDWTQGIIECFDARESEQLSIKS